MKKYLNIGKSHEVISQIKKLKKNTSSDYIVVDDITILEYALNHNLEIEMFLFATDLTYTESTQKIIDFYLEHAKEAYGISAKTYELLKEKENAVGALAVIKKRNYTLDEFASKNFIVVCDHLEIPGNLGTIYRTADACGCDGMIITDAITNPNNPKVTAASRGMNLLVPTCITSFDETINFLQQNNYDIYLGEPELGLPYNEYQYNNKVAIVVGNERFGINPKWYNQNHKKVFIPMYGEMTCLNVSIACAILLYEAATKRNNK